MSASTRATSQGPPPLVRVGEEHYVACYRFVGEDPP
jgi:hypothetical protein